MPISLPNLDDRNFEQLLEEARRRIPVHTPEWTNFELDSDPGVTLVQLFAFLTESLLYRANRIPERNRLKFLQLLGESLQPPAPADGIVTIRNERGPVQPLPLNAGVPLSAGNVAFLTLDPVNVLPVDFQIFYKRRILETDPDYQDYRDRYEALLVAQLVSEAGLESLPATSSIVKPDFYETTLLVPPAPGEPDPEVELAETVDGALYIAFLAPQNSSPDDVRRAIAQQTLSIGVAPALSGDIPPLRPQQATNRRAPVPNLVYERADAQRSPDAASYRPLPLLRQPDVLRGIGIVQVQLPEMEALQSWSFSEPMEEGTGDYPPKLEDANLAQRLVTWLRLRLARTEKDGTDDLEQGDHDTRLTWVGLNATRILQAVPVVNELLGQGNGEPDQAGLLANKPVIASSIRLVVVDKAGEAHSWRVTDNLMAFGPEDEVFTLDPESGQISFGDGLRGKRVPAGARLLASYHYGGGTPGNVGIGAVNGSPDTRLQGGYRILNTLPTSGGSSGESMRDGERNIPRLLRHRDRLVTVLDFRDIARRTPGVDMGRVEVLPLFLPGNPSREDAPGVVTLVVIPRFDSAHPLWPRPDRLFLRRVCDHLDPRRLVTTEIYVRGPEYVPVYVSVGIRTRGGYFPDVIRQTVTNRLRQYLSSLPAGGPEGRGWPLQRRLLRKDLEAVVTRVAGVEYVDSLQMGVKSPADVAEYDARGLELPELIGLSVREGSAAPIASIFQATPDQQPPTVNLVPIPVVRSKC